jgi:hypothetical protein
MDILPSALDSRIGATSSDDDPGFSDLVARITRRLHALGTQASQEQLDATVLDLVQDVAKFTLAWAEPKTVAGEETIDSHRTESHADQELSAESRW